MLRTARNVAFVLVLGLVLFTNAQPRASGAGACTQGSCCIYVWGDTKAACEGFYITDGCREVFDDAGGLCNDYNWYRPSWAVVGDCTQDFDDLWYSNENFACSNGPFEDPPE